jgi:dolichol-phosphate mannosyltransferase
MPGRTLIIIPTYNERENLPLITAAVHEQLPAADILIVDDGSPDGTGQLADDLAAKDRRIQVLHRRGKLGLGTAYVAGFKKALAEGYDYVFEFDADFSHDPAHLPALLAAAERGADLVVGSRWVAGGGTRNWGVGRQLISRGGSLYARAILGVRVKDLTAGFVCYRRRVLEAIDLDSVRAQGYGFQIEMKYRTLLLGFRIEEVPITFADRRVGQSKMSKAIFLEAMRMVWQLKFKHLPRTAGGGASTTAQAR